MSKGDRTPKQEDLDQWLKEENTIVVDNSIDTSNFVRIAELKSTYADLVNLFGEPIKISDNEDRRVQWGFKEIETDVTATIYDDNVGKWTPKDMPLDEIYVWEVGGIPNPENQYQNRAFEIIAQAFHQFQKEGKKFVSKPLQEDLDSFNTPDGFIKNPFEDEQ